MGLSWDCSKEMKNISKDTWEYSIDVQMCQEFNNCPKSQGESMFGKKMEFRIRSGRDKIDMLGANFVFSQFQSEKAFSYSHSSTFSVYPWFFINEGNIKEESLFSPELNETRQVQVFLPPSFKENVYKKYDIVYVNDGHFVRPIATVANLWKKMATEGILKEFVLVGLKNNGTDGDRTQLLTPSNGTQMVCKHGTFKDGCGGCKFCPNCSETEKMDRIINLCTKWVPTAARGEKYLDFIQYTLMSHVSLRYRALSRQQNVGIMGYSLGGLISCHAAWTRPTVFGTAVCMSPSLWWPLPLNSKFPDDVKAEFINKTLKQFRANRPLQKLYLDVGTLEDPSGPSLMLERVQLAARKIANTPFFETNKNLWLQVLDQEPHSGKAFIRRAWIPLQILYEPEGSARNTKTTNVCALRAHSYSASNKTAYNCQFLSLVFLTVCFTM